MIVNSVHLVLDIQTKAYATTAFARIIRKFHMRKNLKRKINAINNLPGGRIVSRLKSKKTDNERRRSRHSRARTVQFPFRPSWIYRR